MDLICDTLPDKEVYGIDLSENVIRELHKKKSSEARSWNVIKGDALDLSKYINGSRYNYIFLYYS
jgi:tRNA G46 methylase TrmB